MNIKSYAENIFESWVKEDIDTVLKLIEPNAGSFLLDAGCGDGKLTKLFAVKAKAGTVLGLDGIPSKIKGVKTIKANLNYKLPLPSNYFDVVISHFSLEHLYNSGIFISESYRILKKGGYIIVATDNLSAWPNIISLLLGWQPFSTTSGVGKSVLGNPLSLRANFIQDVGVPGEYSHNKVMAYQMLVDAYLTYGFKLEKATGVGYFPFSGKLSKLFCKLDKRHAHFLIVKARK